MREGKHASIVTYGLMVHRALEAAAALAKEGTEVEIVDLRTLSPLDLDTVLDSVDEDRPAGLRRRGEPALLDRRRHLGAGRAAGLRRAEGAASRW